MTHTEPSPFHMGPEHEKRVMREAYRLGPEALDKIESEIAEFAEAQAGVSSGVVGVVVKSADRHANFGRTYEQLTFEASENYDFAHGMEPYEDRSLFLYTVDLDAHAIAHTKRIVAALSPEDCARTGLTGLEMIDDRLLATEDTEKATLDEIVASGVITNLQRCLNIATNETTKRVPPSLGRPHVLFSYKAVFEITQAHGVDCVLAYLNPLAERSLGRLGLQYELLGGKEYHLPKLDGGYDMRYKAVCIPGTPENIEAFQTVDPSRPLASLVARESVPVFYL